MKTDTPFMVKTAALIASPEAYMLHMQGAWAREASDRARTAAFWAAEEKKRLAPVLRIVEETRAAYKLMFERK